MPWCEDCARFWNPNSMPVDGRCPHCGLQIADPQDPEDVKAPWHFTVLVVSASAYIGWRVLQLAGVVG